MPVSDNQIDVGGSSSPQIVQEASPSIFIFLGAGAPRQDLFGAFQIYPSCRQDEGFEALSP